MSEIIKENKSNDQETTPIDFSILSEARDYFDKNRAKKYRMQRTQEILERDLNARLTTIDQLEDEVASENPEVGKRSIEFEDSEIPVYDLRGLPYAFLSTTIDYRDKYDYSSNGYETSASIINSPSVWARREDETQELVGFGMNSRDVGARGNTISASYWNSEYNSNSFYRGRLMYGFQHVDGDSIIEITNGDGHTCNLDGKDDPRKLALGQIEELEGIEGTTIYNEFLLRRYSETGKPKCPDFLITFNNDIDEVVLRHAKYFDIPIVNIEERASPYTTRQINRMGEIIHSIDETTGYGELNDKIADLFSIPMFRNLRYKFSNIGRGQDKEDYYHFKRLRANSILDERIFGLQEYELEKRLDYIESTLKKRSSEMQGATARGIKLPRDDNGNFSVPGFDYFNVFMGDGGVQDYVKIKFRIKDSQRIVETTIFDGENMKGEPRLDVLEGGDSSYYKRFAPLVEGYLAAEAENRKIM